MTECAGPTAVAACARQPGGSGFGAAINFEVLGSIADRGVVELAEGRAKTIAAQFGAPGIVAHGSHSDCDRAMAITSIFQWGAIREANRIAALADRPWLGARAEIAPVVRQDGHLAMNVTLTNFGGSPAMNVQLGAFEYAPTQEQRPRTAEV